MPIRNLAWPMVLAMGAFASSAAAQTVPDIALDAAAPTAAGRETITPANLRATAMSDEVRSFYAANGWRPLWTAAAADALDTALAARNRHGLERLAFLDLNGGMTAAGREVARTDAALRYAAALARGRIDPASLHKVYTLPRPEVDLAAGLADAVAQDRLPAWLDGLAPQDDEYRRLSDAYLRYSAEGSDAPGTFPTDGLIRPGENSADMPAIVARLAQDGYLDAGSAMAQEQPSAILRHQQLYSTLAADAVKRLQRDYGIAADGVIGPDTLAVLNFGPGARARALAVAMERRRWLSRTPPATRIDVNTAAASLRYIRDGALADSRNVIVGRPGAETPPLFAPVFRLVANPTWTVPRSIQRSELAHVGADYLAAHNMVIRDGWVVQLPGPDNALGLVKLDMQNDQAIYLHDTSAPALFERSARHLSHGCVRVEDAQGFAALLAEDQGVGPQWAQASLSGEPDFVALPARIPVRLLYHNVFVDDAGQLAFRTDPYGWNAPIARALGFGGDQAPAVAIDEIDLGP